MSRRQRQLDELRGLCASGAVARAIDLAFAHFADFGRDDDVIAALTDAVGDQASLRRRLAELTAAAATPDLRCGDARRPPR